MESLRSGRTLLHSLFKMIHFCELKLLPSNTFWFHFPRFFIHLLTTLIKSSPRHPQENLHTRTTLIEMTVVEKLQKIIHGICMYIIPASSLVKHIGGLIRKTFPWIPPFPTRTPSSSRCTKQANESLLHCLGNILKNKASDS